MSGTTLPAGLSHCWQLSLGPHPLDLSSSTFNAGVLLMVWTILQPSYVCWRQHGVISCITRISRPLSTTSARSYTTSTTTHTIGT